MIVSDSRAWPVVFATSEPGAANAVRSFLCEAGIIAKVEGEESLAVQPVNGVAVFFASPSPVLSLAVPPEHFIAAQRVVAEFRNREAIFAQRLDAKWRLRKPAPSRREQVIADLGRDDAQRGLAQDRVAPPSDPSITDPISLEVLVTVPHVGQLLKDVVKSPRYFRTRRWILRGAPLWDLDETDIKRARLMKPLSFNVLGVAIAAAPATAAAFLAGLSLESVSSVATLVLLCVVGHAAGYYSLPHDSSDYSARRRASHAYWYLNGALGLVPQAMLSLAMTIVAIAPGAAFIGAAAWLWQAQITEGEIVTRLFAVNGYRSALTRVAPRIGFRGIPSYARYVAGTLWALLGAALLLVLVSTIGSVVKAFVVEQPGWP